VDVDDERVTGTGQIVREPQVAGHLRVAFRFLRRDREGGRTRRVRRRRDGSRSAGHRRARRRGRGGDRNGRLAGDHKDGEQGESAGEWTGGEEEWRDIADAALEARRIAPGLPLGVTAYSFGARMTLLWLAQGGRAEGVALVGVPLRGPEQEPLPLPPVPDGTF